MHWSLRVSSLGNSHHDGWENIRSGRMRASCPLFLSLCFSCAGSQSPSQLARRACGYIYWDLGRQSVSHGRRRRCRALENPPRGTTSSFLSSSPTPTTTLRFCYRTQPNSGWRLIVFFLRLVIRFVCALFRRLGFFQPALIPSGKPSRQLIGGELTFRQLSAKGPARLRQLSVSARPRVRGTPRGNGGTRKLSRRVQNDQRDGRALRRK